MKKSIISYIKNSGHLVKRKKNNLLKPFPLTLPFHDRSEQNQAIAAAVLEKADTKTPFSVMQ